MKAIQQFKEDRLITITCLKQKQKFKLIYQFDRNGKINILKTELTKKKPIINSIEKMFPTAGIFEREIHDFFGDEFQGNERLHDKLFLPENWKGKPPFLKEEKSNA